MNKVIIFLPCFLMTAKAVQPLHHVISTPHASSEVFFTPPVANMAPYAALAAPVAGPPSFAAAAPGAAPLAIAPAAPPLAVGPVPAIAPLPAVAPAPVREVAPVPAVAPVPVAAPVPAIAPVPAVPVAPVLAKLSYPQYAFGYTVQDFTTGDNKVVKEVREGEIVKGSYSVADPDGTKRTVNYYADPIHGFNAVVHKTQVL